MCPNTGTYRSIGHPKKALVTLRKERKYPTVFDFSVVALRDYFSKNLYAEENYITTS